jgi:TolA-binding protein
MEPMEPVKRNVNGQLNLNTILLGICVTLSAWALKNIDDLKTQMAAETQIVNENSSAIMGINQVNKEQSQSIGELAKRITVLETIQADQSRNKN